jgi:hypothetical protein
MTQVEEHAVLPQPMNPMPDLLRATNSKKELNDSSSTSTVSYPISCYKRHQVIIGSIYLSCA